MTNFKIGLLVTTLRQQAELTLDFKKIAEDKVKNLVIKKIPKYGEIIYPGLILGVNDAKKAEQEFLKNNVDIILILEIGYATSNIPFIAIQNVKKPVIILNTSTIKVINRDFSMIPNAAQEQYILGNIELACLLKRVDRKHYFIVSGLMNEDSIYEKVGEYLKAAQITKKLENLNLGFIGNCVYPGMMDIVVDEVSVKDKFGINILHLDIREIIDIFKKIKIDEIEKEKERILNNYKNILINKDNEYFNQSIRMAICFDNLIQKYNLAGVANYCQDTLCNKQICVPSCMGTVICNTNGIPFSCEGDIGTAIALFITKELSGNSTHVEFSLADYEKNAILMFHCGNGNLNFARNKKDAKIIQHPSYKESDYKGTSFEFSCKSGEATLLNISMEKECSWKMVINEGKVKYFEPVNIGVPQAWWKVDTNIDDYIEKFCIAGPSHHMALAYGNLEKILTKIGLLLDLNIYVF